MNLFSRDAIQADVLINRLTMLLIVAERIENLGQCQVRQPPDDFFRSNAEFPQLGDRAHWGTRAVTMGAPWRISSVQTMYGWPVAVVMIAAFVVVRSLFLCLLEGGGEVNFPSPA